MTRKVYHKSICIQSAQADKRRGFDHKPISPLGQKGNFQTRNKEISFMLVRSNA